MEELIDILGRKAGLNREQSVVAIETMKEYIQSKLPPMMHGAIESFLMGNANSGEIDILN